MHGAWSFTGAWGYNQKNLIHKNETKDLNDEGPLDSFATPDLPDEIEYNFNGATTLEKVI